MDGLRVTRAGLLGFMRREKHAVQSSAGSAGPQAAVIGIAVGDDFGIVFDTLDTTRKARNLRANPAIAFVIGGTGDDANRTVQYEGVATEPAGQELAIAKQLYFSRFPEGPSREVWDGITYFLVRPTWLRYSDYSADPPVIVEFSGDQLQRMA